MRFNKELYIKDHLCGNEIIDNVFLNLYFLKKIDNVEIEHVKKNNKLHECYAMKLRDSMGGSVFFVIHPRYLIY